MSSAAVHWYWVTAHMYEEQISKGVIAETLSMLCTCFAEHHCTVGIAF